jgi:hypothetical protein
MVKDYKLNTKKVYTQIGGNEVNFEHSQDMLYVGSSPPILLVGGPELAPRPKLQPKLRP